jgi:hypothetical protein
MWAGGATALAGLGIVAMSRHKQSATPVAQPHLV